MRSLILVGAAALALAACANSYVSNEQQACIVNTVVAMQADAATADLRPAQKAALVAQACGVSIDALIIKAAE